MGCTPVRSSSRFPGAHPATRAAALLVCCCTLVACDRGNPSPAVRASSTVLMDSVSVRTSSESFMAVGAAISQDFFTEEASALLGRVILPSDFSAEAPDVVLLSHALWTRLGASPNLVGVELEIGDAAPRVVGVMPPDFAVPVEADLWFPRRAP